MSLSSSGLKGLALGLYISLFFTGLTWLEWLFCTGLALTGYFLGILHDRLPTNNGEST